MNKTGWIFRASVHRAVTGIAVVGMAGVIVSCSPSGQGAQTPLAHTETQTTQELKTAREYGRAVTAWQLSVFDDLSYLPTFLADSYYERGWIKGAFYIGLDRFADATDDAEMYGLLERISRENGFDLGRQPWHADDQAIAAVYAGVAERLGKPEMMRHVRAEFDAILADRAAHGLEFVQGDVSEGGCQRRWCWADALFMGPPSWAAMSNVTGDPVYRDYAAYEARATIEYLSDPGTGLLFRDSRFFDKRTENGKKVFWSRGNGWVFAGLARFIEALPEAHPERAYFIDAYREMAATLITLQREDGYWPTSLADPELFTTPETSGTGFIGFGLAWGLNAGVLSGEDYEDARDKAWVAMMAAVDEDGRLGWVQQVGKDPESTERDSSQIYGAGAFLLMASEMVLVEEPR